MTAEAAVRVVGRIIKSHGLRGELVVEVRTDSPEERFAPGAVLSARSKNGHVRTVTVTAARPHSGRLLVTVEQVTDKDQAEELRGFLLCLDVADLPANVDPDEFYDHQLEGLTVVLEDGTPVGTVREVLHLPSGEVLAVDRNNADDALIPFVKEIVPAVDLGAGTVVVTPPAGLLEDS